jgi:uncharacterized RDD family membrane protein YckC
MPSRAQARTPESMLDTARAIPTPEGIELNLRLAGPVSRSLAWILDLLIRSVVFFALTIPLGVLGNVGVGILLIVWFGMEWLYPTAFEVYYAGATPGKRALGLVVLHSDGTPVGLAASLTRNLLRAADFLPVLYGFGLLSMLMSRDFQRLGDIAAGTVVAFRDTGSQYGAIPRAIPLPPAAPLTADEQRAVLDFAARSPTLTEERSEELASLAGRLTGGLEGRPALERLLSIANSLIGRRA